MYYIISDIWEDQNHTPPMHFLEAFAAGLFCCLLFKQLRPLWEVLTWSTFVPFCTAKLKILPLSGGTTRFSKPQSNFLSWDVDISDDIWTFRQCCGDDLGSSQTHLKKVRHLALTPLLSVASKALDVKKQISTKQEAGTTWALKFHSFDIAKLWQNRDTCLTASQKIKPSSS